MKVAIVVVLTVAALSVPAVASAKRPARADELAAMTIPLTPPTACFKGEVSTVNRTWGYLVASGRAGCPGGDGLIVEHLDTAHNNWLVSFSGSDFTGQRCDQLPRAVPSRTAIDLGLCGSVGRVPRIDCNLGAHEDPVPSRRPTTCPILPHDASLADGADLRGLRWTGWGRGTARATGTTKFFKGYVSPVPVTVTAYGLQLSSCGSAYRVYSRIRVTDRYGSSVYRPETC